MAGQPVLFHSAVVGPRFEQICRAWALTAAPADPDDLVARVRSGVVADPARRSSHEVDVAVVGTGFGLRPPLLSVGEAKRGQRMGPAHLDRLRRVRDLVAAQGRYDTSRTRLACYSGVGFASELVRAAAEAGDVDLVGLEELYGHVARA